MDKILERARSHYATSRHESLGHPPFGTRWDHFRRQMSTAISGFASTAEAIGYGQLRCGFDHRGPVSETDIPNMKIAQHVLRGFYPQFKEQIPLFSETEATTPGTALEFQSDY